MWRWYITRMSSSAAMELTTALTGSADGLVSSSRTVAPARTRRGSARWMAAVATVAGLLAVLVPAAPAAAQVVSNERVAEKVQDFDECNALSIDWTWVTHTIVREDGYVVTIIGRGVGENGGSYVIADVFTPQHFFIRQIRQGSDLPHDDWFTNDVTGSICR